MLSLEEFIAVAKYGAKVEFAPEMIETVNANRKLLDKFLKEGRIIYGVTTGFGENVRYTISPEDANTLQENIVRTHSVAVGEPLDREQARAVMLMTILNDGKGHSGIRIETLDLIRQMLNLDIYPWAPGEGSVGYLGVEGHLAMASSGEGKIYDHGELLPAAEVLAKYGLTPLKLSYKEGLSMLNGTITVTAMALLALYESVITMQNAEIAGALCYEALRGTDKELDPRIHAAKKHNEQIAAAAQIKAGDNLFFLNKYDAAARIRQQLPYVETVQFRRVLPSKLVVQVTECRDPVAIKQDGTVYLLCDRGNIVDTVSAAKWSQYIQIEGLTLLNPQVGSEARASATQQAVLDQLLSMLVLLDDKGMLHEVQVIDLSDAARITMQYMGRFQVEFLWDADFNYKLDYLAAVVEKLEANEKGTIDMTQDGKASFIPS